MWDVITAYSSGKSAESSEPGQGRGRVAPHQFGEIGVTRCVPHLHPMYASRVLGGFTPFTGAN